MRFLCHKQPRYSKARESLYFPFGWEVKSTVWVQQRTAEKREAGQVGP